jgi:hypothetical protein
LFFIILTARTYAFSSNYLESLTQSSEAIPLSTVNYLDSLSSSTDRTAETSKKANTMQQSDRPVFDLLEVAAETPSDHCAKNHPGGYLNNLKLNV